MSHGPLHHFDIKAEALVNGVCFPPNAGLELESLWLIQDEAILTRTIQTDPHKEKGKQHNKTH